MEGHFLGLHIIWMVGIQGISLFYQVLEAMLEKDIERSGKDAVLPLTTCALFHKCLAACAFEVVIAAYRMVRSRVPAMGWCLT